jgi:hypothetical protein
MASMSIKPGFIVMTVSLKPPTPAATSGHQKGIIYQPSLQEGLQYFFYVATDLRYNLNTRSREGYL